MNTGNNRYTGARYVPKFDGAWDKTKPYEALTVVEYQGNSYTSKTITPTNVEITNTLYWACTGNYNAQVEAYRLQVIAYLASVVELDEQVVNLTNKVNSTVNVKSYGAIGNGVADDTIAFNLAVADAVNGTLSIPKGTYKIGNVILPSNIKIEGEYGSIIISETIPFSNFDVLTVPVSGTTDIEITGIIFKHITLTFEEHTHLIFMAYVSNLYIHHCSFIGWKGDAISVASFGGAGHNKNVHIYECWMDGVNKDNRQGFSANDIDGLYIHDNHIKRTTKANMPGGIDVETDASVNIVKNVYIYHNYLEDIGGNVGAIAVVLSSSQEIMGSPAYNINIVDNTILNSGYGVCVIQTTANLAETTPAVSGIIDRNFVKNITGTPLNLQNVRGIVVNKNTFEDAGNYALIGFTDAPVKDIKLNDNTFRRCGTAVGTGVAIFGATRLRFTGNTFDDCGMGIAGAANAIDFVNGSSSYVSFINNDFIAPTGKTLVAIQKEAGHTFNGVSNVFQFNNVGALTNNFATA